MMKIDTVAVDLFAGCGGLSEGLRRAGFAIAAGVENDLTAAATYAANHPEVVLLKKDIRKVKGDELQSMLGDFRPTLVAGCAPCQGFCSLTAKYARNDPRNELLLEMARLIEELRPDAILMENVPGVLTRGDEILGEFLERIRACGYYPAYRIVQMADYGIPQSRRRFVLVAGRGFVIPFPDPTHIKRPRESEQLSPWRTVRDAIYGRPGPTRLDRIPKRVGARELGWHVVRQLQPQTRARLRAAVPGKTWRRIDEKLRPSCHKGDYVGFTNVYGRMSWDEPSPTITSGCVTPAKGRFGHPDRRRTTISVREAALLQTFPEEYKFETDYIDRACEMIGNAVPPAFGEVIGRAVIEALHRHRASLSRRELVSQTHQKV